jgi:hypothetical protein
MRVLELRIGNMLESDGVIVTIDGRSIFDIWTDEHLKIPTKYKPIAITSGWLERFGFHRSDLINKSPSFFFTYVGGSELHVNPENGVVWIERGDNIFNNPALIEHVHQLQNLYFALTAQDLTIKKQ